MVWEVEVVAEAVQLVYQVQTTAVGAVLTAR